MDLRPTGLRQHSHACWSYDTDSERAAVLGGYFAEGLAARERLFYFGTDEGAELTVGLEAWGLDVDALVHAGDLVLGDVEQA